LEELSLDELTCVALTISALENSNLYKKQVVLEWLESPNICKLLISATKSVSNFHNEDEDNAVYWELLRVALSTKKLPSRGG
jgi:hypothetical protein